MANKSKIQEFLINREVHLHDFRVEVAEAGPFVFEWHSHSRPGPSFHGSEGTDYLTDGEVEEIQTDRHYDYPCFDDADYKVSVSSWSWLLRYHSRQYATDDQAYESLTLTVKSQAVADEIVPIISDVLSFGLQDAEPTDAEDITALMQSFLKKQASFADLREAIA